MKYVRTEVDYLKLGKRIATIRKAQGLSQEMLSEHAGITPTNLSHIERGQTKGSIDTMVALANALNVTPNDFLCDSLESSAPQLKDSLLSNVNDCTPEEMRLISDIVDVVKNRFREKNAKK